MNREFSTISGLIADINTRLDDLKTSQPFGGDALIVNEYQAQLSNDNVATYRLTLSPTNENLGVLPSKLFLRWTNDDMQSQALSDYYIVQGYREDGIFEWIIDGGGLNGFNTSIILQYIGSGNVTLKRVV